jgi:hypothetical protein
MRTALVGIPLALIAAAALAQADITAEEIPADQVQLYAPFAMQLIQERFPDPPVKVDLNVDKAVGYHVKQQVGVIMMPDRNLTAKAIEEVGDKEIPVAVLATKSLTVQERDAAVPAERLAVADLNGTLKLPVFFLAVKGKGEDRTLEVYSKDKKSLVSAPLKKQAGDANVPVGLKLTNIDLDKRSLDVKFSLSGAYEGTVKLAHLAL